MANWSLPTPQQSLKRLSFEVGLALLVGATPFFWFLEHRTVSWVWLGAGVVVTTLVYSTSWTRTGQRVGGWFKRIGSGGRLVAIAVAAMLIWAADSVLNPPTVPALSFLGGAIGVLLVTAVLRLLLGIGGRRTRQPA